MRVGKDQVSKRQQHLLRLAETSERYIPRAVEELLQIEDIPSGKESVHPGWIKLFEGHQDYLSESLSVSDFEYARNFFARLIVMDSGIRKIDVRKLNVTFVLGAGASKPNPSGIPTVKELLPQLLERARRLNREDVNQLADFCEDHGIDNIEDLLTAAQLASFTSRNPNVLQLVNYLLYRQDSIRGSAVGVRRGRLSGSSADVSSVAFLQDTLQVLFGLLTSTMLPAKPNAAHTSIASYSKENEGAAVITTNYDCCMDLALDQASNPYRYRIDFANQTAKSGSADGVDLIKLHGSLNWYYCETCQDVHLVDLSGMIDSYNNDLMPYPVIGVCKVCHGQRRNLLVPPLAMKFDLAPPLAPLSQAAAKRFADADLVVVVGFSFAEADVYITRMLSRAMQVNENQQVVIVDPSRGVVEHVRQRFRHGIPGFNADRILGIVGDCSEMLPKFLAGDFMEKSDDPQDLFGVVIDELASSDS